MCYPDFPSVYEEEEVVVFNVTFINILVISWRSVLLTNGGNRNTRRRPSTFRRSLTNFTI